MYVQLMRRAGRYQRAVKYVWLPCRYEHVVLPEGGIDEALLLHMLPRGFLPGRSEDTLLSLANAKGSLGLKGLRVFRPWERGFDCDVLELWPVEPHR